MKFNDFDDGATRWLSDLLCILCISDYVMDFELMVMLCSTIGPLWTTYDRGRIWEDDTFIPPRLFGR